VAQRDQIQALASDLDRQLERHPVIHCWAIESGSQLTFWCRYCNTHHVHGRHGGMAAVEAFGRSETRAHPYSPLPSRAWLAHLDMFASCTYNDRVPGGRGICTCPVGSGDGHRVAHCWNTESAYYERGYILHEVPPNDARALARPKSTRKR
jgi:hypothetical protein